MSFNSLHFLAFFPVVATLYFLLPYRLRPGLLLIASLYFYMSWRPEYVVLMLATIAIDYWVGIRMVETGSRTRRRGLLCLSLLTNLGLLFFFKYYNFLNQSLQTAFAGRGLGFSLPVLQVLLPVGISFYTFQSLSYTLEVYWGRIRPERNLGVFALYVSFFPQLVAGPIERPQNLLPQLLQKIDFDYDRVTNGLKLMLWGMFKKVVIADRLAILVNKVYGSPLEYQGPGLIIATVFFAFQIYCDFSGYSDIAIGAAEVFNVKLMRNFNRPYAARSIREFWGRWHISLSTWFRDYVYIPLGGNRRSRSRWQLNIFLTFFLSGVWHGANWTFAVWGGLHGFYYLASAWSKELRAGIIRRLGREGHGGLRRAVSIAVTFSLVTFAWIFFRANTLADAFFIVTHLATGWGEPLRFGAAGAGALGLSFAEFMFAVALIVFLLGVEWLENLGSVRLNLARRPLVLRWAVYLALCLLAMNLGIAENIPFIYFQF